MITAGGRSTGLADPCPGGDGRVMPDGIEGVAPSEPLEWAQENRVALPVPLRRIDDPYVCVSANEVCLYPAIYPLPATTSLYVCPPIAGVTYDAAIASSDSAPIRAGDTFDLIGGPVVQVPREVLIGPSVRVGTGHHGQVGHR